MKVSPDIRIPTGGGLESAVTAVRDELRRHATQINLISEGRIDGHYNARDEIPSGPGKNGDLIWKRTLSEQGAVGSKYVVIGYACIQSGDPATRVELRVPTGN